jgi:RHS repeat-associated protein
MLGAPVQYDASGDVTEDNQNQFLYNGDGQVCAVKNLYTGAMAGYVYGADGARVSVGTITTWGSCDPGVNGYQAMKDLIAGPTGGQLTETGVDANGNVVWEHTNVWVGGNLMATYDANGIHFLLNDWNGSRRVQTDYQGVVEQTCANLPYGNGTTCGPDPSEYLFAGLRQDDSPGLEDATYRQYASAFGRWTTPDPYNGSYDWSDPQSLDRYAYVNGKSLGETDPSGLADFVIWGWYDPPSTLQFSWLGFANAAAPIIGFGDLFYDLGKSFGWWGGQPQFKGNVKASQNGKNVPSQSNSCPNGTRDATPQEEQQVLQQARSQIGEPYFSGGGIRSCSGNGFDCSGFVNWSIHAAGFAYRYAPTASMGASPFLRMVDPGQIRPGDIMLFRGHTGFYDPGQSSIGPFLSARSSVGIQYGQPSWWGNSPKYLRLQVCR